VGVWRNFWGRNLVGVWWKFGVILVGAWCKFGAWLGFEILGCDSPNIVIIGAF